jgi:hypothetical protein
MNLAAPKRPAIIRAECLLAARTLPQLATISTTSREGLVMHKAPAVERNMPLQDIGGDLVGFFSVLARLQNIHKFRKLGCVLGLLFQFFQCDRSAFRGFPEARPLSPCVPWYLPQFRPSAQACLRNHARENCAC